MNIDVASLAQFGFAAVAAAALWAFIRELIPKLMDVNGQLVEIVQQNSTALAETSSALKAVAEGQRETQGRLGRMDDRLLVLEEQHKYGVRECPLIALDGQARKATEVKHDGK